MAEDADDAQKTEEPTPRKLARAQEKGQTAQSLEVRHLAVLLGGALAILALAPHMAAGVRDVSMGFVEMPDQFPADFEHTRLLLADLSIRLLWLLAPFMVLLLVLAVGSGVVQSGLVWAPSRLVPDLHKIGLTAGFKRMVSIRALVEFAKGLVKLAAVGAVALALAMPFLQDLPLIPSKEISAALDRIHAISLRLALGSVAAMIVIAALDYLFQRLTFVKEMRMTKHEVKDEMKQAEGDPQVKARIRRVRTERARRRMMAAVPKADVVITNPTHFAVALEYKMAEMSAPKLVAKGVDSLARRIREIAEENDVPVVENPPLARALYATVELDEEIPTEHYKAVAEVIGYVFRLKGKLPAAAAAG
jgi:flagellar biosynthetic protein FlhB